MIIPQTNLAFWSSLKEEGDVKKLADITGLKESSIYRIISSKKTTVDFFNKINNFYLERESIIKSATK